MQLHSSLLLFLNHIINNPRFRLDRVKAASYGIWPLIFLVILLASKVNAQEIWDAKKPINSSPNIFAAGINLHKEIYIEYSRNFHQYWQTGLRIRGDLFRSLSPLDRLVEFGIQVRRLWLSEQDDDATLNSEYLQFHVGMYRNPDQVDVFINSFLGDEIGQFHPLIAVGIGKYWRPFPQIPAGLNFNVELSTILAGGFMRYNDSGDSSVRSTQIELSISLFYLSDKILLFL